jgi:hypothetical protein
MSHNS